MLPSSGYGAVGSAPVWGTGGRAFEPHYPDQSMKFYIASRVNNKELVKKYSQKLTDLGHQILSTWIDENSIIPYERHADAAKSRSVQCIKDCSECDVFILVSDESGAGMYTELGAALLSNSLNDKPKIYIIGDYLNRSIFFFHPAINKFETIEEVLEDLAK